MSAFQQLLLAANSLLLDVLLVGSTQVNSAYSGPTIAVPAGVQAGDVLIMYASGTSTGPAQTPSGWTDMFGSPGSACACYKIASGSEPASYNYGNTTTYVSGGMSAYRNAVMGPISIPTYSSEASSLTTYAVTSTNAKSVLVGFVAAVGGVSFTAVNNGLTFIIQTTPVGYATYAIASKNMGTGTSGSTTFSASSITGLSTGVFLLYPKP